MCCKNGVGVDVNKCAPLKDESIWGARPFVFLSHGDSQHVHHLIEETEMYCTEHCHSHLFKFHRTQNTVRGCITKLGDANNSNMLSDTIMDQVVC